MHIRYVSYGEAKAYAAELARLAERSKDQEDYTEAQTVLQKKQFVKKVESVSGYFVDGKEVTDPEEFYDTADIELVTEILRAMESAFRLSEGQVKNFDAPSVINRQEAASSNVTVVPTVIELPETALTNEDIQREQERLKTTQTT